MSKKVSSSFLSVLLSLSVLITAINTGISVLANTQEYSGGSGTVSDPYLISSAEDMAQLDADTVAGKTDGKYYKLTADITLTGDFTIGQNRNVKSEISGTQAADKFISDVKAFQGTFDGNQHTVTYTYKNGYAYGGLFSFLDGAVVENLTVEGTADDTNIIFGSVAAVMNDSKIYNCISNVNISNAEVCTGGIVAVMNNSSVVKTENNGSVEQNKGYQLGQTYAEPTQHLKSLFNNSFDFNGAGSIAGGIAALALGDTVFEKVLNTGHITNSISPGGIAQTGGILGIAKNPSTAVPNVILRAVGNTGNITGVGGENIRTGGVYGGIEWAKYQLDNVWNAGNVSALNGGVRNIKTGSIGGYTYWRNTALCNHRVFAVTGTVDGIDYGVEPYDCKNEFFGNDGVQGTVFICYGGDAYSVIDQYKNSRFDLKSGDRFMEYLGSGWQAVEGDYPILRHTLFGSGSGTVSDPYLISSAEDIAQLDADTVAGKTDGKYYKLTADITLTGDFTIGQNRNVKSEISETQAADKFISDVKAFQGTFDGNQHTVTYTYKNGYAYGGLFSFLDGAVVENLTVEGTADDTNIIFGSVAAVMNDSQIYNCISNVNISNAEVCTGGIVAVMNNSSVVNTENNGSVEQNKGYQSGQTYAGPTQHLQSLFNNSFNFNGSGSIAGGIAALALGDTVFENVLNTGHITNSISPQGIAQTGGILGIAKNPSTAVPNVILRAVGNTGNITGVGAAGENIRTGGVYGGIEWAKYQLDNVWNAGNVSALNGGVRNIKTGSIGGYTYWKNTALGNHRVFAVTGTVDGINYGVEPYDCKNEFFGNDGVQGTVFICYGGDAYSVIDQYKNSRFDLKSGDRFMEYLGSGWRAVDGYAYPTLAYHFTVGDFNNDGALDILDLVSVKKYISGIGKGTDIVLKAADFDENGVVEPTDLASVRKLLLGFSLKDVSASASKVLRVYSHNVCSHGDVPPGPGGETGQNKNRLPRIWTVISENAPNVVVLTECNSAWAAEIAKRCGYKIAENTRTGLSEIQILYNADDFELIENNVDNSERSAFHWVVLNSKATSEELMVYGYHGSTDQSARNTEIAAMNQTISNKKIPTVVAGDFNADYSEFNSKLSDLTRIAEGRAFDKPTWLGWDSMGESTTIDHILYSTNRFDARYFFVLDQKLDDIVLSDHCALLAELEIK